MLTRGGWCRETAEGGLDWCSGRERHADLAVKMAVPLAESRSTASLKHLCSLEGRRLGRAAGVEF